MSLRVVCDECGATGPAPLPSGWFASGDLIVNRVRLRSGLHFCDPNCLRDYAARVRPQ